MILFDLFAFLPIAFGLTLLVFCFVSKQYENTADIDSVAIANYWIGIMVKTFTPALLVDSSGKIAIYLVGIFANLGLHLVVSDFVSGGG